MKPIFLLIVIGYSLLAFGRDVKSIQLKQKEILSLGIQ